MLQFEDIDGEKYTIYIENVKSIKAYDFDEVTITLNNGEVFRAFGTIKIITE